ncbi:hypothetical protein NQT62_05170 [Limnobacter humi]|uniref:Uncharacterized protein n=1 Tax=Limnobacter humi TaxID=1778671 RepID=A0ABT1WE79_9BURK|nr:hypothetical protein [Limnobacter humi]MCQ8895828.1 hypothetical protein [Limnobacter humi]
MNAPEACIPDPTQNTTALILEQLGMGGGELVGVQTNQSFRIEFENQFCVELYPLSNNICRISARLSRLAKSLETQNRQIEKALDLQRDLIHRTPHASALAISNHDNCLRSVLDLQWPTTARLQMIGHFQDSSEDLMQRFQEFVHFAYAFKLTFLAEG